MLISDVKCKKKPDINDRLFIDCFLMVVFLFNSMKLNIVSATYHVFINHRGSEILDLSRNSELVQVKGMPSTLIRLDLQECYQLKASINLSNLVDLKFLCISRCGKLETLNVEGLMSLEEIQAEECLELKSIEGLSQPERLKYLRISTNTGVIWNDICNFLVSILHNTEYY
jgi:hypothetical protein